MADRATPAAEKEKPPHCTCGALDYAICLCGISLRDFLATGSGRRA